MGTNSWKRSRPAGWFSVWLADQADKHSSSPLTTWSFIWMHNDFFLIAATPVVKVFLMLVARRKDSWETPSRPAMEPDRTVAPPARLMNNELMIFLQETYYFSLKFCENPRKYYFLWRPPKDTLPVPCLLLGILQEACSIGGGRILLCIVQPPAGIVLHPVSSMTVAQQEMISLFTLQEEGVT